LFLLILLPQVILPPLSGLNQVISLPEQNLADLDLAAFEAVYDACFPVYTQPSGYNFPDLPAKFVPASGQKILQQHFLQGETDYRKNNDLTSNHPICVYKFSLSVQTSDG